MERGGVRFWERKITKIIFDEMFAECCGATAEQTRAKLVDRPRKHPAKKESVSVPPQPASILPRTGPPQGLFQMEGVVLASGRVQGGTRGHGRDAQWVSARAGPVQEGAEGAHQFGGQQSGSSDPGEGGW